MSNSSKEEAKEPRLSQLTYSGAHKRPEKKNRTKKPGDVKIKLQGRSRSRSFEELERPPTHFLGSEEICLTTGL